MIIAMLVIISLLIVLVIASYFLMKKTEKFEIDEQILTIKNDGSVLKILVNDEVLSISHYPDLLKGESISVKINDKEYKVLCKTNKTGFKFRVEIYDGEKVIRDNGVILNSKQNSSTISAKTDTVESTKEEIKIINKETENIDKNNKNNKNIEKN